MAGRPRILVTLDLGESHRRGVPLPDFRLKAAYVRAVERAGGVPLMVAPTADPAVRSALVELMDGLVVTGGWFDIDPGLYGEAPTARLDAVKPDRTDFELALTRAALHEGAPVPVLAVCGGMQLLNVALGGALVQDIATEIHGALEHEQPHPPTEPGHPVTPEPGSPLARLVGTAPIRVNTTHHQAVGRLGRGVRVDGRAPDGVVEAISLDHRPDVLGVQWHPELLADAASDALYAHLVTCARDRRG